MIAKRGTDLPGTFRFEMVEVGSSFERFRKADARLKQQMLAIGLCLMGAPRLIMFGEPSLGLAPALVAEVLRTIRDLHEGGMTILLVEQNVAASLRLANRAYGLENGRVVLVGSGHELLADRRVREAHLGL